MMRRRAMRYARIEYLPTGRVPPLGHWDDKKECPVWAYEKVGPLAALGKRESHPLLDGVREPVVDVMKEGP